MIPGRHRHHPTEGNLPGGSNRTLSSGTHAHAGGNQGYTSGSHVHAGGNQGYASGSQSYAGGHDDRSYSSSGGRGGQGYYEDRSNSCSGDRGGGQGYTISSQSYAGGYDNHSPSSGGNGGGAGYHGGGHKMSTRSLEPNYPRDTRMSTAATSSPPCAEQQQREEDQRLRELMWKQANGGDRRRTLTKQPPFSAESSHSLGMVSSAEMDARAQERRRKLAKEHDTKMRNMFESQPTPAPLMYQSAIRRGKREIGSMTGLRQGWMILWRLQNCRLICSANGPEVCRNIQSPRLRGAAVEEKEMAPFKWKGTPSIRQESKPKGWRKRVP